MNARIFSFLALLLVATGAGAFESEKDIVYTRAGEAVQRLNLYVPDKKPDPPLIVWVHGGAWRAGSRTDMPLKGLLDRGFAIASVDYRLSTEAPFPAQIHDIKAAIRYLRANSEKYHVNTRRIAVMGSSAGGHLAALAGVSNGVAELEGAVGDHLDQSSDIQCIISLFGASNLRTILEQSTEFGLKVRVPALQLLLGGMPAEKPDLAKLASPIAHLDKKDPPLMLIHGDADPQMPPQQSKDLAKAYEALGLPVKLVMLPGGRHGGKEFFDDTRSALMAEFLNQYLAPSEP